jgi:hypothetical protein
MPGDPTVPGTAADNRGVNDPGATRRPQNSLRLAKIALAWLIGTSVFTFIDALLSGRVSGPVLALDIIVGVLAPFGLLSVVLAHGFGRKRGPAAQEEDEGEGGGGGGGSGDGDDFDPLPPTGGLVIDWPQFEADFRSYASERESALAA